MFDRDGNILLADFNEERIGITDGLLAWFPFWDDLKDRATKLSPFTGTNNGTAFVQGSKTGSAKAVQFNSGTVTIPQVLTGGDWTISAWIQSDGVQIPYASPLSQGHDVINKQGFAFTGNEFYAGTGADKIRLSLGIDFDTNFDWNYFVIKNVSNTVSVYLNNTLVDSAPAVIDYGTFGVTLGADTDGGKEFNGKIQDVRFFGRGITDIEASTNFVLFNPNEDVRAFISSDEILYLPGEFVETDIIS